MRNHSNCKLHPHLLTRNDLSIICLVGVRREFPHRMFTVGFSWAGTATVPIRLTPCRIDAELLGQLANLANTSFFVGPGIYASELTAAAIFDFTSLRQSILVGLGSLDLAVILLSLIGQHARKVKKHRICCSDLRRVLGTRVVRCYKERE